MLGRTRECTGGNCAVEPLGSQAQWSQERVQWVPLLGQLGGPPGRPSVSAHRSDSESHRDKTFMKIL